MYVGIFSTSMSDPFRNKYHSAISSLVFPAMMCTTHAIAELILQQDSHNQISNKYIRLIDPMRRPLDVFVCPAHLSTELQMKKAIDRSIDQLLQKSVQLVLKNNKEKIPNAAATDDDKWPNGFLFR